MTVLLLSGCNAVISEKPAVETDTGYDLGFSENDLDASYSLNVSTYVSLGDEDVTITKAGTYILSGEMKDAGIIVNVSKDEKVILVLDGVSISSGDFAGIYIIEADEVVITLTEGSVNTISDSSEYVQIDENKVDALIFSKADLTVNGSGTLELVSGYSSGIVSKDDLVIVSGTYMIDVAGQGLSGKDALKISDGSFFISSGKDALKSDNDEDEGRGYVYIASGTFEIESEADGIYGCSMVTIEGGTLDITTVKSSSADSFKAIKSGKLVQISGGDITVNSADDGIHSDGDILISDGTIDVVSKDDGIHADSLLQIDGGDITINALEGLEATYVLINDGNICIKANDDGINAGQKSNAYTPTVEINGGYVKIEMGQGDTDAIDTNGYLYINGGTVDITAQFPFDYDIEARHSGGTIIVNGEETDEITNQFGGGFGGMTPPDGGSFPGGPGH